MKIIDGSKGRARDECPTRSNFFHFHVVLAKSCQIAGFARNSEVGTPRLGNTGSATENERHWIEREGGHGCLVPLGSATGFLGKPSVG